MSSAEEYVSRDEIADHLGITPRQISTLVKEHDFPSRVSGRERTFPKKRCQAWYIDFKAKEQMARAAGAGSGAGGGKKAPTSALERKLMADAELTELKLAEMRRQVIGVDVAARELGAILQRLRSRLNGLPAAWGAALGECADVTSEVDRMIKLQELVDQLVPLLHSDVVGRLVEPAPEPDDPAAPAAAA